MGWLLLAALVGVVALLSIKKAGHWTGDRAYQDGRGYYWFVTAPSEVPIGETAPATPATQWIGRRPGVAAYGKPNEVRADSRDGLAKLMDEAA